jgi:hypothetical protein
MATAIGIRSSPSEIYFAIVDDEDGNIGHGPPQHLIVPREALEGPSLAQFVRTNILDVLDAQEVERACVKEADYHPQATGNPERYRIEGVIQEAVASSTADHYISGDVNTLSPHLDLTSSEFREIKAGDRWSGAANDPDWDTYSSPEIESILAAYTAFRSYD